MLSFPVDGIVAALGTSYWLFVYALGVVAMALSIVAVPSKLRQVARNDSTADSKSR